MTWLLYVLAALVVLDAFRLRGRAAALAVLKAVPGAAPAPAAPAPGSEASPASAPASSATP